MSFVFEGVKQSDVDQDVLSRLRDSLLEVAKTDAESSILKSVQVVVAGNFDGSVAKRLDKTYSGERTLGGVAAKTSCRPPSTPARSSSGTN